MSVARLLKLALVWAIVSGVFVVLIPSQLADPFIRADDFPAILRQPELFYPKTLSEGRWINWLWMHRPVAGDPRALYLLYLALWALFAATVALSVMREVRWPVLPALVGVAMAVMPGAALLSLWFGTLLPLGLLLAIFGGVVLAGSAQTVERSMLAIIPLVLLCHSTAPLLMLVAAAAGARPHPGGWSGLRLAVAFVLGLALGLGLIALLNGLWHGVWGMRVSEWRAGNPFDGPEDLGPNAAQIALSLQTMAGAMLLGQPVLMATAAFLVLAAGLGLLGARREARAAVGRVLLALALSFSIALVHMMQSGVAWPPRAFGFLWAGLVLIAALAMAEARGPRRLVPGAMLALLAATGGTVWSLWIEGPPATWQRWSKTLSQNVQALSDMPAPVLLIDGDLHSVPEAQVLFESYGLAGRLRLTGEITLRLCRPYRPRYWHVGEAALIDDVQVDRALCDRHRSALNALPVHPGPGALAPLAPGVVALRLPRVSAGSP